MADPYQTLNVARDADDAMIKKAYRKLAKEYHPDRNADKPGAAERFAAITAAYDLLTDKDKRARFDRGEIDEDGNPKAPFGFSDFDGAGPFARRGGFRAGADGGTTTFEFSGDEADFASIFGDLFGRSDGAGGGRRHSSFRPRGADAAYRLNVSFEDAAALRPQHIELGSGKALDLKLPAGFESGTQVRLRGQGQDGPGGAGDAIVILEIQPHRYFTREGDDVRLDLPVRWDEAVLGAKVRVPTVDGPVLLTVPKGSSSGRTLRIKGKGFHRRDGSRGNQLVRLMVHLPAGDAELEEFARTWAKHHDENPRGSMGV